jgi:aryl-alcohol dehydrogenase-like predicted oxidoreductase
LTGKITCDYKFNPGDHRPSTPYYREPNLSKINAFLKDIKPIADDYGLTLTQLVIHWTMKRPAMVSTLVGARNTEQVSENIKAADANINSSDLDTITDKLDQLKLDL